MAAVLTEEQLNPNRDGSDAAIAVFTAHKHIPQSSTHQTTLQGVVYQLDVALEDPLTQKAGIVFIYDMSNSKYSNFDYDLSQKILTLLKVRWNKFLLRYTGFSIKTQFVDDF
ncbi:unnamed protein product [Brassicogethes aeneus]|uniref:CRAL-TRIO domain-containing protein n=1 Tax=Brassicogethes aeneus TaxID=1431903 RepID=A0A9P0FGC5_BRAAE|nr:unnamed protein product [Brassicogethes aeneus]